MTPKLSRSLAKFALGVPAGQGLVCVTPVADAHGNVYAYDVSIECNQAEKRVHDLEIALRKATAAVAFMRDEDRPTCPHCVRPVGLLSGRFAPHKLGMGEKACPGSMRFPRKLPEAING